jgi:hypothetical protein
MSSLFLQQKVERKDAQTSSHQTHRAVSLFVLYRSSGSSPATCHHSYRWRRKRNKGCSALPCVAATAALLSADAGIFLKPDVCKRPGPLVQRFSLTTCALSCTLVIRYMTGNVYLTVWTFLKPQRQSGGILDVARDRVLEMHMVGHALSGANMKVRNGFCAPARCSFFEDDLTCRTHP